MYCNKYKVILFDSFLCEECEDNPKVSTGYYYECKQLNRDNYGTIKEIDEYCSLCTDINCTGCEYHDVHFRYVKKNNA